MFTDIFDDVIMGRKSFLFRRFIMGEVKWIKLTVDMFDDTKIKLIESMPEGDTMLVIWVKLLTLAGKVNDSGNVYLTDHMPYTEDMLAVIFGRPVSSVRYALNTFEQMGMIERDSQNCIFISNWEKHQNVAGMDRVREQSKNRMREYRERKKLQENAKKEEVTKNVTSRYAIDIDIEEDKDKDNNKKNSIEFSLETTSATQLFVSSLLRNNSKARIPSSLDKWNEDMDKINRLDGYSYDQIENVIDWCQNDTFWKSNILSPKKLREKFPTLLLQMQRPQKFNQAVKRPRVEEAKPNFAPLDDEDYKNILKKHGLGN